MYSISFDTRQRVMHLRLEGFWSVATLARFAAELMVKSAAFRLRHGSFAVLSDSSRFPVQSPAVARGFERIVARGAEITTGPTAIVVASTLNKLQAERSMASPHVRVFLHADEARAWLHSNWPRPEAAPPRAG